MNHDNETPSNSKIENNTSVNQVIDSDLEDQVQKRKNLFIDFVLTYDLSFNMALEIAKVMFVLEAVMFNEPNILLISSIKEFYEGYAKDALICKANEEVVDFK